MAATVLLSTGLAACTTGPFGIGGGGNVSGAPAPATTSAATPVRPAKVGLLLPLSGGNGGLGDAMLRGAALALDAPGAPPLDKHDTAAPGGAAAAADAAVRNGDTIILGPLTSSDTAAASPVAQAANVPMIAFTSDLAQAREGTWVMGITPEQQVRRLVQAAKADGRTRIAALLPTNPLGQAMAEALNRACADSGLPAPTILTHGGSMEAINGAMRQLSDFTARQASQKAATQAATQGAAQPGSPGSGAAPGGGGEAAPTPEQPVPPAPADATPPAGVKADAPQASLPPPPFDALLLADTGVQLQEVISVLKFYGVAAPQVRIMGPGLWAAFASKLKAISGAWYAAPDPASRVGFLREYQVRYHQSPKPLADLAYDAAAVARNLAGQGYDAAALTRPDGFAGVDGVFTLRPDGRVRRGLAVFQIQPAGGSSIVQAAPTSLTDPSS
ncbi:penicillin-binding protein activator [Rhizosaccharibacter radicis]|uniref:Penicillin-binding protein activator n=1 Tax=Rhizosaccharibacter radicis TaxID=2782605 RepID=A0ABT1VSX2_9PROT|nr:penicillin-binding protein activator [Acetobacteraceae bacterium KSS12]